MRFIGFYILEDNTIRPTVKRTMQINILLFYMKTQDFIGQSCQSFSIKKLQKVSSEDE